MSAFLQSYLQALKSTLKITKRKKYDKTQKTKTSCELKDDDRLVNPPLGQL